MANLLGIIPLCVGLLVMETGANDISSIKINQFQEPDKISIHDYEFSDNSSLFDALSHPLDPDFFLFITTQLTEGSPRNLYRYDEVNGITLLERVNADEIDISGTGLFFISYLDRIYFYMDKNLQKKNIEQMGDQLKYRPSPFNPRYIASYDGSIYPYQVFLDDHHSRTRIGSVSDTRKFQWISQNDVDAVVVQTSHWVKVLKMVKDAQPITLNGATEYRIANNQILLICRHDTTADIPYVTLSLKVYDIQNNVEHHLIFPDLLQIKSLEFFDVVFDKFYVVVIDQNVRSCLWSTPKSEYRLKRKTCWQNRPPFQIFNHNVFLSKQMNEVIFVNHAQHNGHITYISSNDGRSWQEVKFQESESAQYSTLGLNWAHYQSRVVPDNLKFMHIYPEKSSENKYFITLDGGFTWKLIPRSGITAIALNHDTVILSIDTNSKEITFSRDHGDSWLSFSVFTYVPNILHVGRLDDNSLKAIIVYKERDIKLRFKILDFSLMFNSLCQKTDYVPRNIPTYGSMCYLGLRIRYHSRNSKTYCKDPSVNHAYEKISTCSCRLLDFQCAYNYRSDLDLCVQDELSCIQEDPVNCDNPSLNKLIGKKYIKSSNNQCDFKEIESIHSLITRPEYCSRNDLTDYILVFETNAINVMYLDSGGYNFVGAHFSQVSINPSINLGDPLVIDFSEKFVYVFMNNGIIRYGLNTPVSPRFLYKINRKIVSMSFDHVSQSLLYLTDKKELYILSLLTNYGRVFTDRVTSFSYSPHDRIISFAKGNRFCYSKLFSDIRCITVLQNIAQSLFDLDSSMAFILTTTRQLLIQRINHLENLLINLFNIEDVDNFVVHLNNLYFLSSGRLFHRELDLEKRNHLLHTNQNFRYLVTHREAWNGFYQQCQNLKCDFMCVPADNDEVECICPSSSDLKNRNQCTCEVDIKRECFDGFCHGFICRNGQCMTYDVRCNGKVECGDASDEKDCPLICEIGMYKCRTECIPSDQLCIDQSSDINTKAKLVPMVYEESELVNTVGEESELVKKVSEESELIAQVNEELTSSLSVNEVENDSTLIHQTENNSTLIVSSETKTDTIKYLLIGFITLFGICLIFAIFGIFIYPRVHNAESTKSLKKAQSDYEPTAKSESPNIVPSRISIVQ